MCGIFGFVGQKAPDSNKLNLLGLLMDERGGDSIGVFSTGHEITRSVNPSKWKKYLEENTFPKPRKRKEQYITIAHARKASPSTRRTVDAAHPFFDDASDPNFLLVHNGVIRNYDELMEHYGIKDTVVSDSEALYMLIDQFGEEDVLSKYVGDAALLWIEKTDNESYDVFAWMGQRFTQPERTLYHGKTKNGLYICSEDGPLKIIGCEDVKLFEKNTITKISSEEFVCKEIKRNPYVKPQVQSPVQTQTKAESTNISVSPYNYTNNNYIKFIGPDGFANLKVNTTRNNGFIAWVNFRYYINGVLADGTYTANRFGYINTYNLPSNEKTECTFFEGVLLNSKEDLPVVKAMTKYWNGTGLYRHRNQIKSISEFTSVPITNMEGLNKGNYFFANGTLIKDKVNIPFTKKAIEFINFGKLHSVSLQSEYIDISKYPNKKQKEELEVKEDPSKKEIINMINYYTDVEEESSEQTIILLSCNELLNEINETFQIIIEQCIPYIEKKDSHIQMLLTLCTVFNFVKTKLNKFEENDDEHINKVYENYSL